MRTIPPSPRPHSPLLPSLEAHDAAALCVRACAFGEARCMHGPFHATHGHTRVSTLLLPPLPLSDCIAAILAVACLRARAHTHTAPPHLVCTRAAAAPGGSRAQGKHGNRERAGGVPARWRPARGLRSPYVLDSRSKSSRPASGLSPSPLPAIFWSTPTRPGPCETCGSRLEPMVGAMGGSAGGAAA